MGTSGWLTGGHQSYYILRVHCVCARVIDGAQIDFATRRDTRAIQKHLRWIIFPTAVQIGFCRQIPERLVILHNHTRHWSASMSNSLFSIKKNLGRKKTGKGNVLGCDEFTLVIFGWKERRRSLHKLCVPLRAPDAKQTPPFKLLKHVRSSVSSQAMLYLGATPRREFIQFASFNKMCLHWARETSLAV